MSNHEIGEKVIELTNRSSDLEDQVQALIMAMFNLNLQKFEKLLTVSYINRGFEKTYSDIIVPFLTKVGYLWQTGTITPAQEHFATHIVRRKITVAIDGLLATYNENSKHFVLFLPEEEQHEISLLYTYYLLKKQNHLVTYLGSSVPLASIDEINTFHQSDYLICSFTSAYSEAKIKTYLQTLSDRFNSQQIFIFGPQIEVFNHELPANVKQISSSEELLEYI